MIYVIVKDGAVFNRVEAESEDVLAKMFEGCEIIPQDKFIEPDSVRSLPTELTPLQILDLLTDAEEDAIQANARKLSRELFSAIVPIPYERFAEGMRAIAAGKLLSADRLKKILDCEAVD